MSEIKWIKLSVGMFDDEKIKLIEKMPDADTIIVIWVKLLALAGRSNMGGFIMLTESIAYTEDMLVAVIDRPLSTIRLAIATFKNFGMIEVSEDGAFYLLNWEKHQNIDGMEKIRLQNRVRKQEERKRKRLKSGVCDMSRDSHDDVTPSHATDIDIELDIELDIDKEVDTDIKKKVKYADYVSMTTNEHQKLVDQYGESLTFRMIEILDNYKGSKGKTYKSDYRAILSWVVEKAKEEEAKRIGKSQTGSWQSRSERDSSQSGSSENEFAFLDRAGRS